MSGLQVLTPTPSDPNIRLAQKLIELERRVLALERKGVILPIRPTTPSAGEGADGQTAVTADVPRIWVKVAGTWISM